MGRKKRLEPDWTLVGFDREASSALGGLPAGGSCDPSRGSRMYARVPHLPARAAEDGSPRGFGVLSALPATCF